MSFRDRMIDFVVSKVIASLLASLDPSSLKVMFDRWIDAAEDAIEASPNKIDDQLLPILRFVRDFFAIPDLPDSD
jgi:hypothetical protein